MMVVRQLGIVIQLVHSKEPAHGLVIFWDMVQELQWKIATAIWHVMVIVLLQMLLTQHSGIIPGLMKQTVAFTLFNLFFLKRTARTTVVW